MASVSLSVVIVAYNSLDELRHSLPALLAELEPGDEVIVVDNASSDALEEWLPGQDPRIRLLPMQHNAGFATGANVGAANARGDLLVLLNPDATVQPGWGAAIRRPWGGIWSAWMGLVLLDGADRINTSGGVLHFTGFGWAGQVGEPTEHGPQAEREVGFLSGACLAIPRDRWLALGGFEEHFFMYCEDVDLSLRLRLAGGYLGVIPEARVVHSYAFEKGASKWRWLERNRWATVVRTYPTALLVLVAPALIATEFAVWAVSASDGWLAAKAQASWDVVTMLPRLLGERRAIQSSRRIDAEGFADLLTATLDSPYFGDVGRQPAVRAALTGYWRLVMALLRAGTAGRHRAAGPPSR